MSEGHHLNFYVVIKWQETVYFIMLYTLIVKTSLKEVTERSILGPIFFLLYINIIHVSSQFMCVLFVDDINILIAHRNINFMHSSLRHELRLTVKWLKSNKQDKI